MDLTSKTTERLFEMINEEFKKGIERYRSGGRDIVISHQAEVVKKPIIHEIEQEITRRINNEPKK